MRFFVIGDVVAVAFAGFYLGWMLSRIGVTWHLIVPVIIGVNSLLRLYPRLTGSFAPAHLTLGPETLRFRVTPECREQSIPVPGITRLSLTAGSLGIQTSDGDESHISFVAKNWEETQSRKQSIRDWATAHDIEIVG